jgi:tRNA(Ser,Leu) C12 N-acetylase TAN1
MKERFFNPDQSEIKEKIIQQRIKEMFEKVRDMEEDFYSEAKSRGLSKEEATEIFEEAKTHIPEDVAKRCNEAFRRLESKYKS